MKQSLKQKQKLSLNITTNLGNQIKLLSLSGFEISSKLNELIENYLLEDDKQIKYFKDEFLICLLYTSPSPRDATLSRMPSSA